MSTGFPTAKWARCFLFFKRFFKGHVLWIAVLPFYISNFGIKGKKGKKVWTSRARPVFASVWQFRRIWEKKGRKRFLAGEEGSGQTQFSIPSATM